MVSSNPAVVTNATRAPLRSSRQLVPTVVPCNSTISPEYPLREMASVMDCEGSSGVEKTFTIRNRPRSIQTQSVKVPPVSTAIRDGAFDLGLRGAAMVGRARVQRIADFSTRSADPGTIPQWLELG